MTLFLVVLSIFLLACSVESLVQHNVAYRNQFAVQSRRSRLWLGNDVNDAVPQVYSDAAKKFKILVCSSTSCAKKRQLFGMDEYETLANMYSLAKESDVRVSAVEECPCLGSCDYAPCIAIEHDDFVGPVALEGMTEPEFAAKAFHRVLSDEDYERVYASVQNAICVMAEAAEQDE